MGAVQKHGSSTTRQNKCREEFWIGEIWISRDFKDRKITYPFELYASNAVQFEKRETTSEFLAKQADDIVRGDDPGKTVILINHGQGQQIVFVELFRHLFFGGIGLAGN